MSLIDFRNSTFFEIFELLAVLLSGAQMIKNGTFSFLDLGILVKFAVMTKVVAI